jgi:hypothetical protein
MKPTKVLRITGLTLCVVFVCGCQKQEDKSGQEAVRLLQDIKTAVSATYRKGEAFVVLKSDAVIYMADMQVLCLKPDFKQHFFQRFLLAQTDQARHRVGLRQSRIGVSQEIHLG